MTPPESRESDPFNTRPSLPLENYQTNWPGFDLSTPYLAQVDSTPPPPPVGKIIVVPEKRRWLHSTQALAIGLLSLAVVILSLVVLSFHQGGIVGFFTNSTSSSSNSSSTTNVHNTTSSSYTPVSASTSSGTTSTSSTPANPAVTATTAAIVPPVASPAAGTPTVMVPTATSTSVPAPTVTFTCQSVSGGKGTPGPRNVAQLCVHTSPGVQVTIAATKCDGSADDNLKQTGGTADSAGNIQWSWTLQDPGHCNQEHVTVTAQASSGQSGQNAIYLQFMH